MTQWTFTLVWMARAARSWALGGWWPRRIFHKAGCGMFRVWAILVILLDQSPAHSSWSRILTAASSVGSRAVALFSVMCAPLALTKYLCGMENSTENDRM